MPGAGRGAQVGVQEPEDQGGHDHDHDAGAVPWSLICRVAAQYDAVFHYVRGRNCGRPFTCLISPNVTKAGAAHTRGESGRGSVGLGCELAAANRCDWRPARPALPVRAMLRHLGAAYRPTLTRSQAVTFGSRLLVAA
jgi:hypothetical protein